MTDPTLTLRRRSPEERVAFREGARLALTMLAGRLDCDRSGLRLLGTDTVSREIRLVFSAIETSERADELAGQEDDR